MDKFWHEAASFIADLGYGPEYIVAPTEMATVVKIGASYRNVSIPEAKSVRALALHKGLYHELDQRFLLIALARLHPSFANEVFIVLTLDAPASAPDDPHIGSLNEIAAWANSIGGERSFVEPNRMAPVYAGDGVIMAETAGRHLIALRSGDRSITPHILRDGYFDLSITRFLTKHLRPGMTYVDVGANVGVYALVAADLVGETGKVVAIEALPRLATILLDNLVMNGFRERSVVIPKAAAAEACSLNIYEMERYCGSNSVVLEVVELAEKHYGEHAKSIAIEGLPLSNMLETQGIERADLIKIDVEGFEYEVLRGAMAFLETQDKVRIIMEWQPTMITHDDRARLLYDFITADLGMVMEIITPEGDTRPTDLEELMHIYFCDLALTRKR